MKQPPMMMMLIPDQVMKALKGSDDQSGEGEPVEPPSGEGEAEGEDMGKGMMHGKERCPVCGRG